MFNKLVVALMPLAPRAVVKLISNRYIAGEDTSSAISTCQKLQRQGFLTTLDILGESVSSEAQANAERDDYLKLISEVVESGIEKNVSLKPTALGLGISPDLAFDNIRRIVTEAHASGVFIRIDMEDSPYTTQTLAIYERLRNDHPHLGTVIQSYMRRSLDDVKTIASSQGNLRICKGIYKESAEIAYQGKAEVRQNFLDILREMLTRGAYIGIATHDTYLIDESLKLISQFGIAPEKYEFQALLGVPIEKRLKALQHAGHRVRIYVPFGSEWYAYSSRRLKENPGIAGYVLKNLFVKN
ncbi:MAG: proline dehydrogenase family protein [Candidatus Marinimicrobia bacterium]|nr:proline dehydrogenase family protein [Candidatus Neomarinimicrobiota bacterium]